MPPVVDSLPLNEDAVNEATRTFGRFRRFRRAATPSYVATPDELIRRRTPGRARAKLVRRYLLAADVLAVVCVTTFIYAWVPSRTDLLATTAGFALYGIACLLLLLLLEANGLYHADDTAPDRTTPDDFPSILTALSHAALAGAVAGSVLGHGETALKIAGVAWISGAIAIPAARSAARILARRRPEYVQNTLIVGAGGVGQLIARKLRSHHEYGLNMVGFVDTDPMPMAPDLRTVNVLGGPADLPMLARKHDIQRVVFSFSADADERSLVHVRDLREMGVQVDIVPRLFDAVGPQASLHVVEGLRVLSLPVKRPATRALVAKRVMDVVVSAVGLVATAPLFIAFSVAIWLEDRGPVLYSGRRIGPGGKRFGQLKFRSMKQHSAEEFKAMLDSNPVLREEFERTQKLTEDPRVTRVGAFLRRTSLDELPQLINVLLGHLSLVGPRPITETELRERYRDDPLVTGYWDVPDLRPGLTGMWQISGRSAMSFDERIRLDTAYLTGWSLMLDLQILAKTPRVLFTSRGAY